MRWRGQQRKSSSLSIQQTSSFIPATKAHTGAVRPPGYPIDESGDLRMPTQGIDRVEVPLERLVVERGMDMRMARPAQQRNPLPDLVAIEVALVAAVLVSGLGDEVVSGQHPDPSRAQFARSTSPNPAAVCHDLTVPQTLHRRCQSAWLGDQSSRLINALPCDAGHPAPSAGALACFPTMHSITGPRKHK